MLLPTFGASESVFRVYVVVVIAGFLVSLVLAWVFEVTPEGVKLDRNVDRSGEVEAPRRRGLNVIFISLLVIALGISVTLNVTGMRNTGTAPVVADDRLSIAVLPFESRSTDPENTLFADGIHDDLLMRLANIGSLRVISRTSVMEYRGTTRNLRQIGDELGVGTVLEGTVQRIGSTVRINAQLVDAATDESIWARSYDRELSAQNIFAIQSEISTEISRALQTTLTDAEVVRIASVPTEDIDAYRLYVQGRANIYKRRLETLQQARQQFEQAVALDPEFAEAWVGLADSVLLLFNNHFAISREETLEVAGASLDRALLLDPGLADAWASLGLLKHKIWDEHRTGPELGEAERAFRRAIELNPNNAQAYTWFAATRTSAERYDEAIDLYHQALRLDPLARVPYVNLPGLYAQLGRNQKALALYVRAVETHPDWPTAYQNLSKHLQGLGRFDEAIAWGLRGSSLSADPLAGAVMSAAYVEFGDFDRVRSAFADLDEDHPLYTLGAGVEPILAGDFDAALNAFESAYEASEVPRRFFYIVIPATATIAGDYAKARDYLERGNPEFVADADPLVDAFNLTDAVLYAHALQRLGERRRADALLAAALPVAERSPRAGISGHGIRVAQILALQGKTLEAIAALREAVDDGFRGTVFTNGWTLELDPYLQSLRGNPEFNALMAEIAAAVDVMRERLRRAEQNSDWDELRAIATREVASLDI